MRLLSLLTAGFLALTPAMVSAEANTYRLDPSHTYLGFAVKHLGISTTRGSFTQFEGDITYDPDLTGAFETDVTIQAASIDTNNDQRDNHLRSSDFFEVEEYPTITFVSETLENRNGGHVIVGDLTIKGVTKRIEIPVEVTGPVKSPFGTENIGLKGEAGINRKDFGITWNKTLDSGGFVVGEDVRLKIDVEAQRELE